MEIKYTTGDATLPEIPTGEKAIIVHLVNDIGKWGKGFVLALSGRYPQAEAAYRKWHQGEVELPFELGQVQFVLITPDLWVANLIGQHGIARSATPPPIRYPAVQRGLSLVADFALNHTAHIHMPRIGSGLAGGNWEQIEPLIITELCQRNINVTVYDLP